MRFLADTTVGKLRRWMSLLGYDVVYDGRGARELLADPAVRRDGRTILGRCPSLRDEVAAAKRFFEIRGEDVIAQVQEVARAFPLDFPQRLFSRCSHCNVVLGNPVPLEAVADRVPPRVRRWRKAFRVCPACDRVYWEGTHTANILRRLREEAGLDV